MNRFYLIYILLLCSCTTLKDNMIVNGNENDAILNAIFDFTHTENRLLKEDRTFLVSIDNVEDNIVVGIIGDPNTILLITEENGSYSYRAFPTMLVETKGRLFFWYDKSKNVTDTIINTLYKHNFVDTMVVNAYIPDRIINDTKKGAVYYFCKNDLSNYKKTASSTLTKYYKPPKLKCK